MKAMTTTRQNSPLKQAPLILAFGLAITAIAVSAGVRFAGVSPHQKLEGAEIQQSRLIRFEPMSDGRIIILDATSGEVITTAPLELAGFLKGVLRGLGRIRRTQEIDIADPYRLEKMTNGQLLLVDTASGISLDMNAYGRSNASVFGAFLSTKGDQS